MKKHDSYVIRYTQIFMLFDMRFVIILQLCILNLEDNHITDGLIYSYRNNSVLL